MNVYVVVDYEPYEGYGRPHAVFSTLEAAEACASKLSRDPFMGKVEVFDYELDASPKD